MRELQPALIEMVRMLQHVIFSIVPGFQLMPAVARAQGLTVNRSRDERSDFERSAFGSSSLIKKVCIPEAKRILNAHKLTYSENEIWFRLFVLHVYHAGSSNVAAVVNKIAPKEGGKELIQQMWKTTAANFGNNSQNYSQLALASQFILHDMFFLASALQRKTPAIA